MNAPARTAAADDNRLPLITLDQLKHDFAHVETAIAALEKRAAESAIVLEDDDDLASDVALIGEVGRATKRADELRDIQGRPHLEAKRIIDTFFKLFDMRLSAIKAKANQRATAYMNKKAEAARAVQREAEAKARALADAKAREAADAIKAGNAEQAHAAQAASDNLNNRADHAADAAAAKPADLARTQTDSGTATLAQTFEFEIENIDLIDLEALRPFLPRAAIEQAMRSFVKSGRREIKGARIFSKTAARFRA
jgi:colicin import membrane protein